jgi:hypothetical protein
MLLRLSQNRVVEAWRPEIDAAAEASGYLGHGGDAAVSLVLGGDHDQGALGVEVRASISSVA